MKLKRLHTQLRHLHIEECLPMELLYANDLALMAETKEFWAEKIILKVGLEEKGLKVNM